MPPSSDHVSRAIQAMAALGFSLARSYDIVAGRPAAAALVGDDIATVSTMLRVQARSGCTSFVARSAGGGLIAAVSAIPLTLAAVADLVAGRFNGVTPADRQVARPADTPMAFYIWGAAGFTWRGRRLALAASIAMQREVYPTLPLYARAATDDGARVLQQRMGANPLSNGLAVAPAWAGQRRRAA